MGPHNSAIECFHALKNVITLYKIFILYTCTCKIIMPKSFRALSKTCKCPACNLIIETHLYVALIKPYFHMSRNLRQSKICCCMTVPHFEVDV